MAPNSLEEKKRKRIAKKDKMSFCTSFWSKSPKQQNQPKPQCTSCHKPPSSQPVLSQCPDDCRAIYATGPPNPDSNHQTIIIRFTTPFPSRPYVFVEPLLPEIRKEAPHTFATTVQRVTRSCAVVNVTRVDQNAGWDFGLHLQYYAFTTPYMKSRVAQVKED